MNRVEKVSVGQEWDNKGAGRLRKRKPKMIARTPIITAYPGGWAGLRNKILAEAGDLLDIRLLDVMRWAWKKGLELEAYRDAERYPPDKTFSASLMEHKITSNHAPHVDIRMNDKKVGSIQFAVNIEPLRFGMRGLRRFTRATVRPPEGFCAKASFSRNGNRSLSIFPALSTLAKD